ncbi:hypothetical protein ACFL60_03350 [Candidatus Omnitrophota bacterium]
MDSLKGIVIVAILMCFISNGAYPQDNKEWETILAGADLGDNLITSGIVNVAFEYVRVDSLSTRTRELDSEHISKVAADVMTVVRNSENIDISFTFSGERVRFNERSMNKLPDGRWYTQEWQWAYNGEKLDLLRLDGLGENDLVKPKASIRTGYVHRLNRFDPRYNGLKIRGTTVGSFLRGTLGEGVVTQLKIVRKETVDGVFCTVIKGDINSSGNIITVWLAPEMLYRPKRIKFDYGNETIMINTTFKEYLGDVWFPETVVKEKFYLDRSTGKEMLYYRETITVTKGSVLNTDIPVEKFENAFPSGLSVYDYRLGEYLVIE